MGAPLAIQVADRWHLLKNAGDMLVRVFDHHHRELKQVSESIAPQAGAHGAVRSLRLNKREHSAQKPPTSKRLLRFDRFRKLLVRAVERFYPPPLAISVFVLPESVIH